ncbi:MAG: efflux RND transporter periplasmic adaptor subunit [Pseudomonadota bacterium]
MVRVLVDRICMLAKGFAFASSTFAIILLLNTTDANAQQEALPVDVAKPLVRTIVDWDEYTGRFEAVQKVEIRPRVSGYIDEILFRDGQLVEKGDLLMRIDPRPFQATLDSAKAQLASAEAEQRRTSIELERGEELVATGALSVQVLDERLATKLRADAQIVIAQAAIRSAELNVEFTEIRAPFDGRISDREVNIGALVVEGNSNIATLIATDPIYLVFTGSEADFLKYSRLSLSGSRESSRETPNPVEARLIDEKGWPHKGVMNFVDNELDPGSGTIRARAIFDNPDEFLVPGLFARLRVIGSGEYEALLLPDEAVLSDQARKIVLVVDEEGVVEARVVELGPLHQGLRVIRSGIVGEDRVIVNGVLRARPGGKVAPVDTVLTLDEPRTE